MNIAADITQLIGRTPLLELGRFAEGCKARVVAKCEFLNPMSVKDRAVLSMVTRAEERGDIRPGEPSEVPILSQGEWQPHRMMGTAPGFIPEILDRSVIDEMLTVSEAEAFAACRELARTEGVLVGISSGAVAHAARQLANRPEFAGRLIVCALADRGERYLSVEGLWEESNA